MMQSSSVGDDQDIDMTSSQFGESNADSDDEDCDDREVYATPIVSTPSPPFCPHLGIQTNMVRLDQRILS